MSDFRHITWENFKKNYIDPRDPARHRIPGMPETELFTEAGAQRIGIHILHESTPALSKRPLSQVELAYRSSGKKYFLEVSTTNEAIYEPFYALVVSISDLVQLSGVEPIEAINRSLDDFERLLAQRRLMPEEKIVGLWGEMWFLEKLILARTPDIVREWMGPLSESHDFRLEICDVEVKTTRHEERVHVISALNQLEPSPGRPLYLLSVQIAESGPAAGRMLPQMVTAVRNLLTNSSDCLDVFNSRVSETDFKEIDSACYNTAYITRSHAMLIAVDDDFPRITRNLINRMMVGGHGDRIGEVYYRVNVTGLGYPEGSKQFKRNLG